MRMKGESSSEGFLEAVILYLLYALWFSVLFGSKERRPVIVL